MRVKGIDHVGLHVADLERALAFYRDLLGLRPIRRPDLGFPGAWLRVGAVQELHLIGKDSRPGVPPEERHWSIEVEGLDAWRARLAEAGVEHRGPIARPDGATQLFVRDPDGHVLELLERAGAAAPDPGRAAAPSARAAARDRSCPAPIFVLGVSARCGTNFLCHLLARHPDCDPLGGALNEDHLFGPAWQLESYVRSLETLLRSKAKTDVQIAAPMRLAIGRTIREILCDHRADTRGGRRPMRAALDALVRRPRRIVTKTPAPHGCDLVHRFLPDAKVLLLVRDGKATVESMCRSFEYQIEDATRIWADGVWTILDACRTAPERFLLVRYEALVRDLERELRRVLHFVDLPEDRYDFRAAADAPVFGSSAFGRGDGPVHWQPVAKSDAFQPIERARHWTSEHHARFDAIAGDAMRALGY